MKAAWITMIGSGAWMMAAGAGGWGRARADAPAPAPEASQPAPALPAPPPLPADAERSRTEFDKRLGEMDQRAAQVTSILGAAYASLLRDLRTRLQAAGRIRDMVAVHDELARYDREKTLPAPEAVPLPSELAKIASRFASQARSEAYTAELEIVEAANRHLQNLASFAAQLSLDGRATVVAVLDAERDRVAAHPRVRAALAGSAGPPPTAPKGLLATQEQDDPLMEGRKLRMAGPSGEDAERSMAYTLEVTVREDRSRMYQGKVEGPLRMGLSHTVSGPVVYRFHVTLAGRNGEIPPDSRLVAEYFKRGLVDQVRTFHAAEEIKLPKIGRKESRTFDLNGVELVLTETLTVTSIGMNRSFSGHDFYGLIVSVVDASGRILFQRFSPQQLGKEVSPTPGKRP